MLASSSSGFPTASTAAAASEEVDADGYLVVEGEQEAHGDKEVDGESSEACYVVSCPTLSSFHGVPWTRKPVGSPTALPCFRYGGQGGRRWIK